MKIPIPPCPVCRRHQASAIHHTPFDALNAYWSGVGINLAGDYPEFKGGIRRYHCRHCGTGFFVPSTPGAPSLYDALSKHDWYYEAARWEHSRILGILERNGIQRCLEVGCGDGGFLVQIAEICPSTRGIETNPRGNAACLRRGLDVTTALLDSFPANSQDAIVLVQVLEHIQDTVAFVQEAKRCLRPSGLLIVSVPNEDGVLGLQTSNYLNMPPHHVTLLRKSSFNHLAAEHGFTIESYETQNITFPQYLSYYDELASAALGFSGTLGKVARHVGLLLSRAVSPLAFETAKHRHAGHTHLAVLRNIA